MAGRRSDTDHIFLRIDASVVPTGVDYDPASATVFRVDENKEGGDKWLECGFHRIS